MDSTQSHISLWLSVNIGTGIFSPSHLLEVISDINEERSVTEPSIKLCPEAVNVITWPTFDYFLGKRQVVNLTKVTPAQLGFGKKSKPTHHQIYRRAIARGLRICPHQLSFQLRIQHLRQPENEHVIVATEPIPAPLNGSGSPCYKILSVKNDGKTLWLVAEHISDFTVWDNGSEWVFMLP